MSLPRPAPSLTVEESGEDFGHCDCCGQVTRSIWGLVDAGEATVAAYWIRWTEGHPENGSAISLCLGPWGAATTSADREFVFLISRLESNGRTSYMVVDPNELTDSQMALANRALRRNEVIGTPLAPQVFAVIDAIALQDSRLQPQSDDD